MLQAVALYSNILSGSGITDISEEAKRRFFPGLKAGGLHAAILMNEPSSNVTKRLCRLRDGRVIAGYALA